MTVDCAVPTARGVAVNCARVLPGETVAIGGTGGVGVNAVQGAAIATVEVVIAVDLVDWKVERAKVFGASHTSNPLREGPVPRIVEITHGIGADATILTPRVVTPALLATAMRATRKAGQAVIVEVIGRAPNEPETHSTSCSWQRRFWEQSLAIICHAAAFPASSRSPVTANSSSTNS